MKKYLLSKEGNFYKSNLHCHSTVSDGAKTPEELKEIYMNMGYSVLAYTDHNAFIQHNDLSDDKFLALNGFELDVSEAGTATWNTRKCCHICYIALDADNSVQPMWNKDYLTCNAVNYADKVNYDKTLPPYVRRYNGKEISEMMRIGREAGFFVTYNHPTWSKETYKEYIEYDGMHAFEMFNGSCIALGYEEYNPRVYDDMLTAGKRIYCIGSDDNHNHHDPLTRKWDSGVAFTVIKAEKLEYKAITDALLAGNFYASEKPTINEFWVEDGKVHIECSEADKIFCTFAARKASVAYAEEGKPLTSADFAVDPAWGYFRITVVDKQGYHACTNAYFL